MALSDLLKKLKSSGKQQDAEVITVAPTALGSVLAHFPVYRDSYRLLLRLTLLLGLLQAAGIIFILFIIITAKPQDRFFTSSVIGQNNQIYPADTPFDDQTVNQIVQSVVEGMNFGYLSYETRFAESKAIFTSDSIQQKLIKAITGGADISTVIVGELSFETIFDDKRPFQIIRSGISPDLIFEAVYDIPVTMIRKKGSDMQAVDVTPWLTRVLVRRVLQLDRTYPFVIADVEARPVGPAQTAVPATEPTAAP